MALPSLFLSVLAGIALGVGLHNTKLASPNWMAKKPSTEMILSFLSIFSFSFFLQVLIGDHYLSGPYLGVLHFVGGLIFGTGIYLVKSCPLSMFNLIYGYEKKWQSLILIIFLFLTGIYSGQHAAPLIIDQEKISGYSLYIFDLLNLTPNLVKLFLLVLTFSVQIIYFKKSGSRIKLLISPLFLALGIYIAQLKNIEVGTIVGFKNITNFAFSADMVFFIFLFITLLLMAKIGPKEVLKNRWPKPQIFIGFFLFGLGGELGGGCTLTHGLDGMAALSLGSLVFVLSAVSFYFFLIMISPRMENEQR